MTLVLSSRTSSLLLNRPRAPWRPAFLMWLIIAIPMVSGAWRKEIITPFDQNHTRIVKEHNVHAHLDSHGHAESRRAAQLQDPLEPVKRMMGSPAPKASGSASFYPLLLSFPGPLPMANMD